MGLIFISNLETLASRIRKGDKRALSRAITLVENQTNEGTQLLNILGIPSHPKSHIIGITGAPGAGKSTLVNNLIQAYLSENKTVGVLAVDPSSPFSGGAVLGDRIRMLDNTLHPNFFMRSMGSRGHLGGLVATILETLLLFEHFGFDIIIVETVGAGQSEVEIADFCDTTVVVVVPGLGDSIQHLKAGIMEIADIFVVNKADLPGAETVKNQIHSTLTLIPSQRKIPPILLTSSTSGTGIDELVANLQSHFEHLKTTKTLPEIRKKRIRKAIQNRARLKLDLIIPTLGNELSEQVYNNSITLDEAAKLLLKELKNQL
ncbi:MAG: methylmalonyl Co-A mutase-associated GTPase MeaB [Methanobacteriota archaeon]|nr:MAG: methylmalonyl Co-A mutase-associated GTPase MeaB [Euryarchaeota archaeon]